MDAGSMVIRGCRTLESDAEGTDTDILVKGGVICKVGDVDPCRGETLDAGGLLALPGLMDCHVHLVLDGSPDILDYVSSGNADLFHAKALEHARRSLHSGFTYLRDMGCFGFSVAGRKAEFDVGIYAAGHMLIAAGGHVRGIGRTVRDMVDAGDAVGEQAEAGANFIKAIASGGLLTPDTEPQSSEMPKDMLNCIASNARECRRPLAVHAYGDSDVGNAIAAGAVSVEHGYWASPGTLRLAASKGTFFVPTLKALRSILDNADQLPGHVVRNAEAAHAASERMVRRAAREGVVLAMGTDSGTPFNFHGENAMELVYMHELGLPAELCLAAATRTAAELLGMGDTAGNVSVGYRADIILVKGDPLADPGVLCNNPVKVMRSGRFVSGSVATH